LKDRDENPSLSNHKPPTARTPPRSPREYRGGDGNRERYANFDQSSREPSQQHETGWYTRMQKSGYMPTVNTMKLRKFGLPLMYRLEQKECR